MSQCVIDLFDRKCVVTWCVQLLVVQLYHSIFDHSVIGRESAGWAMGERSKITSTKERHTFPGQSRLNWQRERYSRLRYMPVVTNRSYLQSLKNSLVTDVCLASK